MITFDFGLLQQMVAQKYVTVQKHPKADLYIYNYTPSAQYERLWNAATLASRGLILNDQQAIIARPFPKFFNLEEHPSSDFPNEPFEVFEKMDGSLGILYWIDDQPFMATRGSFDSEQAQRATAMLYDTYRDSLAHLRKDVTYLFEIIYPNNRIVVDYGAQEKLVLLAMIDTATGQYLPLEEMGFPIVPRYDGINDLQSLRALPADNKEGFVIRFRNGFMVKVKFEEYVRLHRILTQISTRTIWTYLKEAQPFDALLERVPDEFFNWVRQTKATFQAKYQAIETTAQREFSQAPFPAAHKQSGKHLSPEERKTVAQYFVQCTYPKILFAMLDERDYSSYIWQMIYPMFEKPFNLTTTSQS
ncbi:MAG: T4 RnlA family RNA ligase [Thermonemataceae bacterium]